MISVPRAIMATATTATRSVDRVAQAAVRFRAFASIAGMVRPRGDVDPALPTGSRRGTTGWYWRYPKVRLGGTPPALIRSASQRAGPYP